MVSKTMNVESGSGREKKALGSLLIVCAIFVAISVGRVTELFPILAPLHVGKVTAFLLLLLLVAGKRKAE